MEKTMNKGKSLPEKKFNAGAISVTIWRNEIKKPDGTISDYPSIALERSYKDQDGKWHKTNNMRVNDLPKAAMAMNKAYEYLSFKDDNKVETVI